LPKNIRRKNEPVDYNEFQSFNNEQIDEMDNMIKTKHLRVSTTKEEKQTLEHLLQNELILTEEV